MNKNIFKNIAAVIIGFVSVAALSIVTDAVLEKFVTSINLVFALFYRSIFTIIGGYITARLSSTNPMRQVYIVATIGFLAGTLGAIANWDKAVGNEWYPVLLAISGPLFVYLGGKLFLRK